MPILFTTSPLHGFALTSQQETPDSIRAFEDLGVDRLVVQLGSHKADAIDWRLPELESLMKVAA